MHHQKYVAFDIVQNEKYLILTTVQQKDIVRRY
jgi:hypothetical protein